MEGGVSFPEYWNKWSDVALRVTWGGGEQTDIHQVGLGTLSILTFTNNYPLDDFLLKPLPNFHPGNGFALSSLLIFPEGLAMKVPGASMLVFDALTHI